MINFRFHRIAVTGVALAVAVGLTLGAAALGPAAGNVQDEARSLRTSNAQLRDRLAAAEDELGHSEGYVKDSAPLLLDNRLAGKRVLVLALPGADQAHVAGVTRDLKLADATLTGTVRVTERFSDPENSEDARDLATRLLPPNVTDVPSDADGVTASAMVLAAVLLEHRPAVEPADITAAVTGYEAAELIEVDGELRGPAQGVVIVSGRSGADPLVTLTEKLAAVGPTVAAAPGVGDGSLVAAVREDAQLGRALSTVDNVHSLLGQLSSALALAEGINDQKTGHYGVSDSADRRLPTPAGG